MRRLTDKELEILERVKKKTFLSEIEIRKVGVHYVVDGNFTIAIVQINETLNLIAAAKRNPVDKQSEEVGCNVALSRALRSKPVLTPSFTPVNHHGNNQAEG